MVSVDDPDWPVGAGWITVSVVAPPPGRDLTMVCVEGPDCPDCVTVCVVALPPGKDLTMVSVDGPD